MTEVSFHEITKVFPNGTTAVDALTSLGIKGINRKIRRLFFWLCRNFPEEA